MKQGWEIKKLDEVCKVNYGTRVVQKKDGGSTYPVYGGGGATFKMDKYNREDCLIVARFAMSPQCVRFVQGKFFLNDSGLSIESSLPILSQKFLDKHVVALNDKIYSLGKGAAQKNLDITALKNLDIHFPTSLAEQEKIVAELDCLSGIIEKKKQQLKELDALAQSIFYEMFGNPVENEKGWGTKRIEDICDVYRGGSPRPIDKFLGGNIPWIKIGDATQGDSIFLTKTKEHIIEEGLRKTRFIHSGSLIFANCGVSLGFARIITFDGCIHDGWLAFDNISEEIDKIFFLKSLNFCTPYFRSIAPDGVQPNLNTSIMKAFNQIIPPLNMQKNFVDKIRSIEKQKSLINRSLGETETLLKSRMDYYFN